MVKNFPILYKDMFRHLPKDVDYINLFHNKLTLNNIKMALKNKNKNKNNNKYFIKSPNIFGMVCYIITLSGAKKLYNFCYKIQKPVDDMVIVANAKKMLNMYVIKKSFLTTNDYLKNGKIKSTYKFKKK